MQTRLHSNSVAIMMCVADEAATLPAQLAYHRHIGVSRAYVYVDQSIDGTRELLSQFDWVEAIEFPRPPDCPGLPLHQTQAAFDALERSRRDGVAWLMHIDPDEFAWPDPAASGPASPNALVKVLASLAPDTELVHLMPREVLPERGLGRRPFWTQCYFQVWPQLVTREILNPVTGLIETLEKWAGHAIGKSIVATHVDAVPREAHSWLRADGGDLRTVTQGFHYHFVFMGPALWQRKYQKLAWEPDSWIIGGKVPFPKQAWKEASVAMSSAEAEAYYERWVAFDRAELQQRAAHNEVTRDTRLFETLGAIGFESQSRDNYFIKEGYAINESTVQPVYSNEDSLEYQKEVYQFLAKIITERGVQAILDVGCGYGLKLERYVLPTGVEISGVDTAEIINETSARHAFGNWIVDDIEMPSSNIGRRFELIVSSDVIEHLYDPDKLLAYIKRWSVDGATIVLSTPERDLRRGPTDMGPPRNRSHVREWNRAEFLAYLQSRGLKIIEHRNVALRDDFIANQLVVCRFA